MTTPKSNPSKHYKHFRMAIAFRFSKLELCRHCRFRAGSFSGLSPRIQVSHICHVDRHGHFTLKQLRLPVLNESHTNSYTGPRLKSKIANHGHITTRKPPAILPEKGPAEEVESRGLLRKNRFIHVLEISKSTQNKILQNAILILRAFGQRFIRTCNVEMTVTWRCCNSPSIYQARRGEGIRNTILLIVYISQRPAV
jgi:hypothetical protein